jgi:hypothetical protein
MEWLLFYAYTRNDGDHEIVNFSNIERFQITGTNFNDSIYTGDGDDIITDKWDEHP